MRRASRNRGSETRRAPGCAIDRGHAARDRSKGRVQRLFARRPCSGWPAPMGLLGCRIPGSKRLGARLAVTTTPSWPMNALLVSSRRPGGPQHAGRDAVRASKAVRAGTPGSPSAGPRSPRRPGQRERRRRKPLIPCLRGRRPAIPEGARLTSQAENHIQRSCSCFTPESSSQLSCLPRLPAFAASLGLRLSTSGTILSGRIRGALGGR